MINYKPISVKKPTDSFQLNRGLDTLNNANFLDKGKITKALNILYTDNGWTRRFGTLIQGQTGASKVNGLGVINLESGDIFVRAYGTKFQELIGTTRTDVGGVVMSDIPTTIVSFTDADLTTVAVRTGGTTSATNRTFVPDVAGMTINAYVGKILRILTGTGAGQEKLISTNDATTIYIEGVFQTTPDATSTYDIREVSSCVIVTNGTDTVFKYDGTTVTTFPTMKKWTSLEVAHNRLFGATAGDDNIYYSNLGSSFFPADNFIPVNPNGDVIQQIMKNLDEVIIYKKNARYRLTGYDETQFQLINADIYTGCIAPKSVVHGNNYNFFLGAGGVYSINTLDYSSIDKGLPVSTDVNDSIFAHTTAELESSVGWLLDNRYYLAIGDETFIFDILHNKIQKTLVWSTAEYGKTIYSSLSTGGKTYIGSTQVDSLEGDTDNGVEINVEVISDSRIQGDPDLIKIYGIVYSIFNSVNTDCNISVYYSVDGGEWNLGATKNLANGIWSALYLIWSSLTPWLTERPTETLSIRFNVNKRAKTIRFKYIFAGLGFPEFIKQYTYFNYANKLR